MYAYIVALSQKDIAFIYHEGKNLVHFILQSITIKNDFT